MPSRFNPDADLIRKLAAIIDETGLTEIEYADGDRRIRVARMPGTVSVAAPAAAPNAAPIPAAGTEVTQRNAITSPMVGTAYLTPEPGAPNFVKPGDRVNEGQTLLIIEAMKVMNPIKSPRSGVVSAILIENVAPVEYGQPLIVID